MSAFARGFRLSTELVAGVLVGALIGWLLDRWLGISPWGLIVFLLLGFAAGVLNVMRAAGVASDPRHRTTMIESAMADPDPSIPDHQSLPDRPDRGSEIAFTNSASFMLIAVAASRCSCSAPPPAGVLCRRACNRSPSCPTNSSPARSAAPPARTACNSSRWCSRCSCSSWP